MSLTNDNPADFAPSLHDYRHAFVSGKISHGHGRGRYGPPAVSADIEST